MGDYYTHVEETQPVHQIITVLKAISCSQFVKIPMNRMTISPKICLMQSIFWGTIYQITDSSEICFH